MRSVKRLATRWLVAASRDFDKAYALFKEYYGIAYTNLTKQGGFPLNLEKSPLAGSMVLTSVIDLFWAGKSLCHHILTDKEVPTNKMSLFARTSKLFGGSRSPRLEFSAQWFVKNLKLIQMLLESDNWLERGETKERALSVGSISVINQTSQAPDAILKLMETATSLMKRSKVPSISRVLYGDVFIVGDILRKKNISARYFPNKDYIQVLMIPRFSEETLKSLIHEFGHRYWNLNLVPKNAWTAHHVQIKSKDTSLPKRGEVVEGVKGSPIVQDYQMMKGQLYMVLDGGGYVKAQDYRKFHLKKEFPTQYSATSPEEHFCEAFALYCMGDLKNPHKTNFEALVMNRSDELIEKNI